MISIDLSNLVRAGRAHKRQKRGDARRRFEEEVDEEFCRKMLYSLVATAVITAVTVGVGVYVLLEGM